MPADASTKEGSTQFWFWTSEADRRFTGRRLSGRTTEYYKDIRAIALDQGSGSQKFEPAPIAEYTGGDIYIVAAVPVTLSAFDQRFIDPVLLKVSFIDSARRASR